MKESEIGIYWYYRLRIDALKKILDVQDIQNNELRQVSRAHSTTVGNFKSKILATYQISRFETAIFAALQRRLDYYAINSREHGEDKNLKVKKINNDEGEVITNWKEARDYIECKRMTLKVAKSIYEITYEAEINGASSIYSKNGDMRRMLIELHHELKDQPIPQEFLDEVKQTYMQKKAMMANIDFDNLGL